MFVPEAFTVPAELVRDRFCLRMLSVAYAHKDYEAVMETQARLQNSSHHGWPREGFTIGENVADLERHEREFISREAFAYTMVTPDDGRVLGCVYINPGDTDHDAVVRYWVRESERDVFGSLAEILKVWLASDWPFASARFDNVG